MFELALRQRIGGCSEIVFRSKNLITQAKRQIEQSHELMQRAFSLQDTTRVGSRKKTRAAGASFRRFYAEQNAKVMGCTDCGTRKCRGYRRLLLMAANSFVSVI